MVSYLPQQREGLLVPAQHQCVVLLHHRVLSIAHLRVSRDSRDSSAEEGRSAAGSGRQQGLALDLTNKQSKCNTAGLQSSWPVVV
jgi:hypothetical protein